MVKIKVPAVTLDAFVAFGDPALEAESERQEQAQEDAWAGIYNAIVSGASQIAYWDNHHCLVRNSFMRYTLHRSTKQAGYLQLSVMEIRHGEIIPTSDTQHDTPEHFLREVAGTGSVAVTVR